MARLWRGPRRALRFALLAPLFALLGLLPARAARRVGAGYGRAAFWLMPDLRRRTRRNLAAAFPEWPAARREAVARRVTLWVGRAGADFLQVGRRGSAPLLAGAVVEGMEHWREAVAEGRGVIATTGHLGHWELLGAWFATLGLPVTVLYHPFTEARLARLVQRVRERAGVTALSAEGSLGSALRALRRGGVLGVVIDRPPRGAGVEDRFFGRPCRTAPGAARIAWLARAPILPAALWYEGDRFRVALEPPVRVGAREAVEEATRALTSCLERQVRRAPEQWPWFENRWKVRTQQNVQ